MTTEMSFWFVNDELDCNRLALKTEVICEGKKELLTALGELVGGAASARWDPVAVQHPMHINFTFVKPAGDCSGSPLANSDLYF